MLFKTSAVRSNRRERAVASIYDLKPQFQALLRPVCRTLAKSRITANQVTIASIILSCIGGACVVLFPMSQWPMLILPVILFLRMALNALDGMLAKEFQMQSSLGAILNELGDVISDAVLYLPFALLPGVSVWGIIVFVLLATLTEMTGVLSVQIGGTRRYDGPFGKSDRAFAMGVLAFIIWLGISYEPWVNWIFAMMCLMSVLTILKRARNALREVAQNV